MSVLLLCFVSFGYVLGGERSPSIVHSDDKNLQAPRFTTSSPTSSISRLGTAKIMQCQAFGYPQPQYRWMKDGQPITELSTESFYKIFHTKLQDEGSYRCIASNKVGSIMSEEIKVIVAYMGIFENQTETTVSVDSGQAAILDLPFIESSPEPQITWQTDEGPLIYSQKHAKSKLNQLIILSTDETDKRAYRARAMNTQEGKEENSAYIRLDVIDTKSTNEIAPEIIVKPTDVEIVKGTDQTSLDCIANARPLHELETLWFKDGILIDNSGIQHTFNDFWNRSLTLISANLTHTGVYECQVSLKTGGFPTVKATANVVVLERPRFVSNTRTETLGEYASQISLPCDVVGIPKPTISWYRNTINIDDLNDKRYKIEEDNSLLIKRLTLQDMGMFQCFARNQAGESYISTWLKVKNDRRIRRSHGSKIVRFRNSGDRRNRKHFQILPPTSVPVMETGPENATVLDGKDVTVTCQAAGAPEPNITWIYNGDTEIELTEHFQKLDNGDLLITDVRKTDAGLYTCIRSNEAGQVNGSAYISVLVRTQIIQPPAPTRVLLGHTATLQCKVSSDPTVPYQLDWYHNKQLINPTTSSRVNIQSDGTLEIQAVRAADVGNYSCTVRSPGGNETRTGNLDVIELPYSPFNVKAIRLDTATHRAVNVSWTPGFDGNDPIKQYIVQKREVPELGPIPDPLMNWATEINNVSADQRWVLLTNLKAAASYQFRVSAVNSVGEGNPSDPSNEVMLPQEAPSGPPVGFVGSARSSSEIITQWQPPLEEHRNGQILGYIISYRLFGYNHSPWTTRNITNEAQRNYLITDLITWKDYSVKIAAYNNKGVGKYTDEAKIKTREGVPEAPPEIISVEAVNSTAVSIMWTPPDPQKINGINQGYKIQAWKWIEGAPYEARMMTVHPNLLDPLAEQTALLNGLEKFTEYNITVLCFTDPGDGEVSDSVPVKTTEDVPDEITNLQFDEVSDRAVKVTWSPPKRLNGILTGYQVKYQVKDDTETMKYRNLSANTTSIKVIELQATTHYRFEVTAWTAKGAGPAKVAIIQSGVEPVLPHPPSKLALSNIEAFSVVLQFTPGFDGNSSITKWIVEAKTKRNLTWFEMFHRSDPDATTITVTNLTPFTEYRLRLIAQNVVGASRPSEPTKEFQTIQAPPSHPPRNVTVRAMSATELRVRWIPLQQMEWYGNPRGYNITYIELGTGLPHSETIEDPTANSHIVAGLEEFALYEITMQAYNDVGSSAPSPRALERTRESVPSFGPLNVIANATSSTTIVVKWGEVPKEHQNGQIEGYKVYYGADTKSLIQYKLIPNNSTFTTTLTELRKFVLYHIQVLAYTRLGDGVPTTPPVRVQTFEDVPGAPSNVSFPDVSFSSARIIWDVPDEPNGEILAYRVTYQINDTQIANRRVSSKEFPPSDRTFRATNLEQEMYYIFSVTAQTRLGWGKTAHALVLTTNNREIPQSPSAPQISKSQIQADHITFSWTPGRDGFAPLRYYTVQKMENGSPWQSISERVDPQLTSYTASGLKPYTAYRFRIQATNDIGPSSFSVESDEVRTYPAAPSRGTSGLRVVPITTTSVEVYWEPVDKQYWSGDIRTGGYYVIFHPVSDYPTTRTESKQDIMGIDRKKMVLNDLMQDRNYEIKVQPFNSRGKGPESPPVTVYVGEAVPTGEPRALEGEAISSTEVKLRWKPPQQQMQNGELLGYKIFYLVINSPDGLDKSKKNEEEIEVVPATAGTHSLVFLDKYTQYRIQILAFNPAGDGPRSKPITVKTLQGLPGPPVNLIFSDITMNSLKVSWDPPLKRNGDIMGYIVTYETTEQNERFSKQVKQKVTMTSLNVISLEEEVTYTFTVRALTIDFGPAISSNVTTGPQEGSPGTPKELALIKSLSSIELHWLNGPTGKGPILGYYIECRKKDDSRWSTVTRTINGPLQDFTVSYQSLLPSTSYNFRVIPYNKYGISYPATSDETVLTPSKLYLEYGYLQHKPFYRQTWFMVALAAISIIIIITIIAILCVKSKSYKYKQEAQKTLEESMAMSIEDRQDLALELYRSRGGAGNLSSISTMSKRGTLARKAVHPPPQLGKSPPRPAPGSVAYHSDEESLKGYDENPDDSSVTEKPSEMSSSDQGSESENESVRSDPHSFVNHYANVNDTLRQSWKRQKPVRHNYSSYTDSEPEGSAVVSLNGGQIILNNMARSRAPLPGFSSFV